MADEPGFWSGLALDPDGPRRVRRRHVDTGLSLLPRDPEGSHGDPGVRDQERPVAARASLRDGDTRSAYKHWRESLGFAATGDGGGLRAGDDSSGGHGEGRGADVLPALGALDHAELPPVANGHREEISQAASQDPGTGLRDRDD